MLNVCCGVPILLFAAFALWRSWRTGDPRNRKVAAGCGTLLGAFVLLAIFSKGRYIVLTEGIVEAGCTGDAAQIERLIAWGADPNKPTDEGGLALPCAVGNGHVEAARALLRHGADPNRYGMSGYPAEEAKDSDDPSIRRLFGFGPKGKR